MYNVHLLGIEGSGRRNRSSARTPPTDTPSSPPCEKADKVGAIPLFGGSGWLRGRDTPDVVVFGRGE